jgi:hypothetical protein
MKTYDDEEVNGIILSVEQAAHEDGYGGGFEDGVKYERARIVGLFDAEEEQISEQDWTNNSMKRLDAHQRIIEGLREKK